MCIRDRNFGARLAGRVRQTFRSAVFLAGGVMFAAAAVCVIVPRALMALFASDPGVIRVGEEYLRIVALNYVASGVVFVSSSMFQAMGNTVPPLIASFGRLVLVAMPVLLLARLPGFQLAWIWWLSAASIWVQMGINLLLLKREFARRLDVPAPVA